MRDAPARTPATSLARELEAAGFHVTQARNETEGWQLLGQLPCRLVIQYLERAEPSHPRPLFLLRALRSQGSPQPRVPVLLMTDDHSLSRALEAGRAGATGLFSADAAGERAALECTRALMATPSLPSALLGDSVPMRELRSRIHALAPLPAAVLLSAETGTSRQAIARYIHQRSARAPQPFVVVDVSSAASLAKRVRGATAYLRRIDHFDERDRAHWLQHASEVRLVASIAEDASLPQRRAGFRVDVPPLRRRPADIPQLVSGLIRGIEERLERPGVHVSASAMDALGTCPWPGNLAQLESTLEALVAYAPDGRITAERVRTALAAREAPMSRVRREREQAERRQLLDLYRVHGTYAGVARALGITRNAAKYRFTKHGLLE
jgi:DNA-binding NtrC family response regulator